MNTKILVIAVVAIVAVSAVSAAAVLGMFSNDNEKQDNIDSKLAVYGNADENETVDSADLEILQEIIDGTKSFADYPLADANADNKTDTSDVELLKKIIARENTTMYIYCIGADDNPAAVAIEYPLRDIVIQGTNTDSIICEIGVTDLCAGYFNIYANAHSGLAAAGAADLKGSQRGVSAAAWANFMDLDSSLSGSGGVGAIIADAGSSALAVHYDAISAAGVPFLRFAVSDTFDSISSALTIGFICGEDAEKKAYDYATRCWDVFDEIESKIANLSEDQKKAIVSITMGSYIAQSDSNYTQKAEYAGGKWLGDIDSEFASLYTGTGSTKMSSMEALSNYDTEINYILSFRAVDYKTSMSDFVSDEWDAYRSYYENLDCYSGLTVINSILPQICQTAYASAIMYPDLFTMEWADGILKAFLEDSSTNVTFDDIITVFTLDDYVALS